MVFSAQLCAFNQGKYIIRAYFLLSGNLDGKALLLPAWERWPGLSVELHSPMFCTGFRGYRSCLCEEEGFFHVIIMLNICYPWLSHSCWGPCFIAVGSASSQIKVCSINTGTAVECCAGAVSGILQCVKYRVWLLSLDCLHRRIAVW